MQGRLSPKYNGRYQAHPVNYWQEEFNIASKLGLETIEFILDYSDIKLNPLMNKKGIYEIQKIIEKSGVLVESICADYFMEAPFHSTSLSKVNQSIEALDKLINNSSDLGVKNIVIPCVDHSSLKTTQFKYFSQNIIKTLKKAEQKKINLCLETDLSPEFFLLLLKDLPKEVFKVNYDIGNSASLGYNVNEEFEAYGDRITDIHIKDRLRGGGSVELGKGNANFDELINLMKISSYDGQLIMQVYRDDEGIEIFEKQLLFFKEKLFKLW
tara:strand:- start:17754 stop:18560 length:807 start_codon:yes stop_codon:yes gene_type:complete